MANSDSTETSSDNPRTAILTAAIDKLDDMIVKVRDMTESLKAMDN